MKRNEKRTPIEEYERRVRIERAKIAALSLAGIALFAVLLALFAGALADGIRRNRTEEPAEGIGRESAAEAQRYAAPAEQAGEGTALRVFCETDPDLPEWWDPEGAEVVYQGSECNESGYYDSAETGNSTVGTTSDNNTHSDALDYNLNTTLWGWDGHGAEAWELELFARIFYLEFWGASPECCEAGCDAILRLWESGEFGDSLGGLLAAKNAAGKHVYSTYPAVWTTDYDADGLAWCRAYCEERFAEGPVWIATYFQKYGYPSGTWNPIPCYEIDGVYFSVAK